jgi:hypothetical protein
MRRWAGSWISSADRCAAPVTTIKEGTTRKCYLSLEYKLLPITWTVHTPTAEEPKNHPSPEGRPKSQTHQDVPVFDPLSSDGHTVKTADADYPGNTNSKHPIRQKTNWEREGGTE